MMINIVPINSAIGNQPHPITAYSSHIPGNFSERGINKSMKCVLMTLIFFLKMRCLQQREKMIDCVGLFKPIYLLLADRRRCVGLIITINKHHICMTFYL